MSTVFWYVLIIGLALLLLWTVGSWWVVKDIEQPDYQVLEKHDGYEIRAYESYIVAETVIEAENEREALNEGFRIVADYIFGNNASTEKVSMTSPVLSSSEGEKISMTAPVLASDAEGRRKVAFVMPKEYSLETLPVPNDDRVILREVPAHTVAAHRFGWYATDARIAEKKEKLIDALTRDGITVTGMLYYAGYNPPLTIPFIQRHEVLVNVAW